MPLRSTSVTMALSWISTPIFSSRACAFLPSFSPIGGSTAGAASSRITRALVESMCRNAPLRVWSESSAICPAISTPVGPAPTTMKVSSFSRRAGSLDRSACSKAPRMRPRSSSASSMDFMPGANSAKWSLPKYDCPAPAATIRRVVRGAVGVAEQYRATVFFARSMWVTSPSSTWAFFCLRRIIRVGGAISPEEMMPVATWYSSGWNRWCVVLAMILMSTSARLRVLAAVNPPNPDPMMTTLCRSDGGSSGVAHQLLLLERTSRSVQRLP